jgi:peptide/nickel transport system ATP-binding protein
VTAPLLDIQDLVVEFGGRKPVRVVDQVSFSVRQGEAVGVVGESGSGKSLTALSILRLVAEPPARISGRIRFEGRDLMQLPRSEMPRVRGKDIGMIFQEPMSSLNPVMTIGAQIDEALLLHEDLTPAERRARVIDLLRLVGMPDPESRLGAYPDQFSGGMRQRVMAAMAMACNPKLLIADEPTTALDVTIQAQVLALMLDIRKRFHSAILLITHDLGIVAGRADRVAVMYAGQIVEEAPTESLFARPSHPYTQGLFASIPRITGPVQRLTPIAGSVPPPGAWPTGCRFRPRCPKAFERSETMPPLLPVGPDHRMRCWLAETAER